MKSLCLAAIASILVFSSCNKKAEHQHEAADTVGTHTHKDGAVHKEHEPKQDSTKQDSTSHGHSHDK